MASQLFSRSRALNVDVNPSPETMYHFSSSPSEPGKFDFYRVHLANQVDHSNSTMLDNSDAPVLSTPTSSTTQRRWTPFADLVAPDQSNSSVSTNSSSLNPRLAARSQTISLIDSSGVSNANNTQNQPIKSVASFSSLTDIVKNAMNKNYLSASANQIRRPASGTTLSTKDLNHLSPQSM